MHTHAHTRKHTHTDNTSSAPTWETDCGVYTDYSLNDTTSSKNANKIILGTYRKLINMTPNSDI
jgi:hypothetical protein